MREEKIKDMSRLLKGVHFINAGAAIKPWSCNQTLGYLTLSMSLILSAQLVIGNAEFYHRNNFSLVNAIAGKNH